MVSENKETSGEMDSTKREKEREREKRRERARERENVATED